MALRKVGIIGSGMVGQALAKGFVELGYQVKVGSRSPEKLDSWTKEVGGDAYAGTFDQAAAFGDAIALATNGAATEAALDLAGPRNFAGKLVLDVTNPLDFSRGMPPTLLAQFNTSSLGELVQRKLPDAKVVKCFNTVPSNQMFRPTVAAPRMLICGDDASAKGEATEILRQFGWSGAIDVGGIDNSRWLEALVILWVKAAAATQGWNTMFNLVSG